MLHDWVGNSRVTALQLGSPMMISCCSITLTLSTNLATLKHLWLTMSSHLTSVRMMSLVTQVSTGSGLVNSTVMSN